MPVEISVPEVPGDPAGMRALAGALKGDARDLEGVASGLSSAVGSMTFDAPAAERFRTEAQGATKSLGDSANRLTELAQYLETKAHEVEEAQKARLREINNIRHEMAQDHIPVRITA